MESINVMCAEIQITDGFEFRVPADRFTLFQQSDCESVFQSSNYTIIHTRRPTRRDRHTHTDGFEFRVPADRFTLFQQSDCEPLWYSQDGRLIAHPANPLKLIAPVISVSSDRLVTSHCVNELRHRIYCDASGFSLDTIFRARNETAATPDSEVLNEVTPDLQHSDQLWWISALLIVILLLVLICFLLRKRIFRCFQSEEWFICQHEALDNRDLVMLGSDPPGISSVNRFSESAQSPSDADHDSMV
ncbi:uncharacterized protein [Sinocyclocheilus grahami]|uniref:uncharacterized protein n=1 Tax=Sinocyclocheilus grahami TaxID=75366 RepID=UPI0007ACE845|nr:PREDICTED: uncharacterized protein LOC107572755 [Sinocyclocheilus grahami]